MTSPFLPIVSKQLVWITVVSPLVNKVTIHQVTTMLATSKNILFPGHSHLLTTGDDDSSLIIKIKVSGYQYRWLAGG